MSLQKDDWVEIKNIGEVVSGSTPKTTNESYWGGENKWITPAELSSNTYVITKTDRYLTDEGVKSCSLRKLPKDTVLLTSRAPIGKVAIAGTEMYCNQGFKNIICNEKIRPKYLFYLLKNNVRYLEYLGRGATFKEISKSIVENVKIPLFPLQDQDRFIEFAEQIDKSKFLLQQILKKLELLKKSRFIEMFGDPIKNEKRWAQLTLNSVCDGIGDGLHGTPEYDDSGDFYFINGNNLINGEIVITPSTKKVNEEVFKKYYRNISSNALLLSINGTLGKIAFYNNEAITLGKSACYINLKTFVNKYFVFELMKTDHFLKYLEENSTKSTIKNVSLKTIRNFQLISPPENLQNDFISFSKKIDKSKLIIQKALEDLVGKV